MSADIPNGHAEDQPLETPGAGPSRLPIKQPLKQEIEDIDEEEQDRLSFLSKQADYVQLEQSVQSSDELLSSLASYLSTFQNDLSAVSGQISDLQGRSADIESQLKGRKTIIPPLNALISDITLPPSLVLTLRDTLPAQNPDLWLNAIIELDSKISLISSRSTKVKAVKELSPIIEGLKVKALNVLPPFLLSLIKPLKSASKGLSTNLAILQNSLLLKYQPFYAFLYKHNGKIAKTVERGYVNAARSYYETGYRRYARSLGLISAKNVERAELIGSLSSMETPATVMNGGSSNTSKRSGGEEEERLRFKDLDIEDEDGSVVLGYMADDKDFRAPIEALFRSLALVLLDNASSEFTFIVRFFAKSLSPSASTSSSRPNPQSVKSPIETPLDSPNPSFVDLMSDAGKSTTTSRRGVNEINENLKEAERIWHEVFDSSLEYTSGFFDSMITPPITPTALTGGAVQSTPSVISLLTMIRLNDNLLAVSDNRGCLPLVGYLTGWKLKLWPVFRKEMDNHIASLKTLADNLEGKNMLASLNFMKGSSIKDSQLRIIAKKYGRMYSQVVALSNEAEEVMIFSSMTRLRNELIRIVSHQSSKIKQSNERHSFLSSIYEIIMHELVSGVGQTTHPKLQSELSFFRTREEEARRRITA
ncbi:uncharacterized protein I303_105985 [Kwoniella dejecticola CBS 10117]|uniref:Vacuolar protein sorting-associated protein 52 n=1 Tax=Kwoniella dejecticola CBS 10117 TaxID=1296121 RepID=A0A1A6A0Y8_9TREE|nr:uncharacterized protein I303_06005 [Kwoniella dejecticola CBS 10117]OBR83725.1 hypothetical protein I303_06005 [Kwoniella dejecticola CBS 10117]